MGYDWKKTHADIMDYFRLRTLPIVFKYYDSADEMLANKRLTRPEKLCNPCLAVAQAVYTGACVCLTPDNLNSNYCRSVNNLREKDEKWLSAMPFYDRWNSNMEAAQDHHKAITTRDRLFEGFAAAPLEAGAIENPDGCLMYVSPEQLFWVLVSNQNEKFQLIDFTFVGESTCSDSLLTTAIKGKIGMGIGGFGERAFGALPHTEVILTMPMAELDKALKGAAAMRKGREYLSHPVPPYSTCADISCTPNPHFEGY